MNLRAAAAVIATSASEEAIQKSKGALRLLDCFASLATTERGYAWRTPEERSVARISAAGRAEIDLFLDRLVDFFRRQEDDRLG